MSEKIPHYINDPIINAATAPELKLHRPQINYIFAVLFVLVHFVVGILIFLVWTWLLEKSLTNASENILPRLGLIILVLFLITLRFSLIWFVKVYQHYGKSETRLRCCMTPSCSEYAILAFKKYGALWGGIKTFKRLLRCHPPGGTDYP
ncbi:membrane protein insertion efficiency factor YidD [Ruminococcaceae bacterium OttesenSCG-928-L11]|nr:membrane protein insertion efficiency factor YidD [Ruminococcaceae bacterium OttesenSCG-928-L11]